MTRRILHPTNIALAAIVATVAAAVMAAYLLIFINDQDRRFEQDRWHWQRQIVLIDGFIGERLRKHLYQDVEVFLVEWARDNPRIAWMEATFPQGGTLASFNREAAAGDEASSRFMPLSHEILSNGRTRLMLNLGIDVDGIEQEYRETAVTFGVIALVFTVFLVALIWFIVRRLALHPLEASWLSDHYRKEAEIRKLAMVADRTSNSVIVADGEGRIEWVNQGFTRLTGYSLAEVVGRKPGEILRGPDTDPETGALFTQAVRTGQPYRGELINYAKDGRRYWAEIETQPIRDEKGNVTNFIAIESDVTARKEDEAALRLAASVYHNTIEGILISEADGTIVSVNPAFTEITGYTAEEVVGGNPRIFKSDRHDDAFYRAMWQVLAAEGQWQGEIWNRRKNGQVFLEWQTITRIPGPDKSSHRYVSVFSDITELRSKDERIEFLAFHDPLTDLPNRALLHDRLDHSIGMAERAGDELAVFFLDLDRFKVVNDTLGHDSGDELLKVVAERLKCVMRATDTLSRLGGDEFVVVLQDPGDPGEIAQIAERMIQIINLPMEFRDTPVQVGASVGIALYPTDGTNTVTLMKNADTAMYAAKSAGKNTFFFFNRDMTEQAEARLALEVDLRGALERGEFELVFQPKVSLATSDWHLCGAEALIRWNHPERGQVSPAEFIPIAEETGLIIPIGDWVLRESCRIIALWRDCGINDIKVAINLSAVQFREGHLGASVRNLLHIYGLDSAMIEVELTESTVMSDPDHAIRVLTELRELGLSVAVDDFGTGYSSLGYLRRLPLDTLKIDRTFVKDAVENVDDGKICRTIVALGHALNLDIVAEGIETQAQADFLSECGCGMGQGYLFAKPLTEPQFRAWREEKLAFSAQKGLAHEQVG